jgi:putative ABC transport system substrate-binding protein
MAALGGSVIPVEVRGADEIYQALKRAADDAPDLIIVPEDALLLSYAESVAATTITLKLPTVFGYREQVQAGGLVSYGIDLYANWHRAAIFVDKILRGSPPGELPIELPTKFETFVNLRTAKALGLMIPPTLLARADEVIE